LLRSAEGYAGERSDDFVDRVIAGINRALAYPEPNLVVSEEAGRREEDSNAT
jgi:hypothetical protein